MCSRVSWSVFYAASYFMCICIIGSIIDVFFAAVPGVLSVQPDANFGSDDKDYAGLPSLIPFVTFFVGFSFCFPSWYCFPSRNREFEF